MKVDKKTKVLPESIREQVYQIIDKRGNENIPFRYIRKEVKE